MSARAVFDLWCEKLPESLRPFAAYGEQERAKQRGEVRLLWVPGEDSFSSSRDFRAEGVLLTRRAGVTVEIAAGSYAAIEDGGGLLDCAISALHEVATGRYEITAGGWLRDGAATTRGAVYLLSVVLPVPVRKGPHVYVQPKELELTPEVP